MYKNFAKTTHFIFMAGAVCAAGLDHTGLADRIFAVRLIHLIYAILNELFVAVAHIDSIRGPADFYRTGHLIIIGMAKPVFTADISCAGRDIFLPRRSL